VLPIKLREIRRYRVVVRRDSQEMLKTALQRLAEYSRRGRAEARRLGRIVAHKFLTGVEFLRLKRQARMLQSQIRDHSLVLAQLVVRLDQKGGEQRPSDFSSEIKSEIEAISRREGNLKKIGVQIAEVRSELKRPSG
jgi:hypothetical protein